MKKRMLLVLTVLLIGSLLITACGPAATEEAPAEEAVAVEEEVAAEEPVLTCALITPNPLGDRSFIDSSARGIERANAELPVKCDIIETNGVSEHESALRGAVAEGYGLVLGLAMDAEMFMGVAQEFPDVFFSSPSEVWAETLPENMSSYLVEVHEGSFLIGLIAGSMTDTKIVGAVVGGDSPGMNQFTYGYEQGVAEACPDCEVLVSYLSFDFANPTLGLETALGQYDQGADIVYQVAGRSGEGVLEAAAQRGLYAFGVDSNQDDIQPGSIITSMIKRVDMATYDAIQQYVDGTFAGGFFAFGLGDGFAGVSWDEGSTTFADNGPAEMVAKLPAAQSLVDDYRAKIVSGAYEVCDSLAPTAVCDPYIPAE
ncbi:MAG: BMP family ABC transporter substrate-binding protein [Pelolinea sp.]|nr:BMP family ABC transporter substrate-binding protein [Pelolinea sp.]